MRVLFFLFVLSTSYDSFAKETLNIAVASNFYEPIKLIKKKFEKKNEVNVKVIKGSTAQLYAQIFLFLEFNSTALVLIIL